ncbi:hypothetical protein KAR28_04375 [Candidatus Parcubacteria bacterium]|nr:hypothetical protein [Candidatus Parcubacteria bacterium]
MKKIIREFLIIVIVALTCTSIVYAVDYGIIGNDAYLDSVYVYNAGGYSTQLKASSTATANNIIYLPTATGTVGQIIKTDGTNILYWADDTSGGFVDQDVKNGSSPTFLTPTISGMVWDGVTLATSSDIFDLWTTDNLSEGSSNLYYTNNRVDARILATTSLPQITTLLGLTNASTTQLTVSNALYLGGNINFATDDTPVSDRIITVDDQTNTNSYGNAIRIIAGKGNAGGQGGILYLTGGAGGDSGIYGTGGGVHITSGAGGTGGDENGGWIKILGGAPAGSGSEGKIYLGSGRNGNDVRIVGPTQDYTAIFDASLITSPDKTFTFPNKNGTFAMTSDVTGIDYLSNIGDVSTTSLANGDILNYQDGWQSTSSLYIASDGKIGVGTTSPMYALDVNGSIQTNSAFYGDYWISATNNSMNIQPTGDTDDFFSFKTPADRPTIKREGGKYIYIESSNVNDVGISFRKDADHSGTINYYKDENLFGLTSKDPLVFKVCGDYDDYVTICNANSIPEISVASSSGLKVNAGGTNPLLLNHDGGNVGIGTTAPAYPLDVWGDTRINGTATTTNLTVTGNTKAGTIMSGTWNGTVITDAYISNTLTVDGYMQDGDINSFSELQSWVSDETLLKAGTLTDTKYCIYDSASTDIICNSEGGAGSSEWTDGGLFLYPTETSDVVVIGGNATTSTGHIFETIGDILTDGLTIDDGATTSTSTIELGADTNIGCIKMRDSDRSGWSYLTILNGILTASVNSCE